jgi:ribosomal protein S18 acetylase RimI-like enzyme
VLQAFENELARCVSAAIASEWPDQTPSISVADTADDSAWLDAVATGFAAAESASPEAPPAIEEVRETAAIMQQFLHPSIRRYLALADGKVAGAGAAFVRDGVLGVFGTATLPRFRRRGVQTALTRQCLLDHGSDADLAIATTLPGSISQRTFERLGFRIAYTRAIFILPAPVAG